MFSILDLSVLADFEEEEIRNPCPRKEMDGRVIYTSRAIRSLGMIGPPVLCDFGSAVFGEEEHIECVQPNAYRSPEVTLRASWDYKIDIWSVGCMVSDCDVLAFPWKVPTANEKGRSGIYTKGDSYFMG